MKKQLILIFLLTWGSALFAQNLIRNPGFEEGNVVGGDTPVPGWNVRGYAKVLKYHHVVGNESKSGKRSALIEMPDSVSPNEEAYFTVSGFFPVAPGKSYRVSFWAKPERGNGSLRMVLFNSKKGFQGSGGIREIPVRSDINVKDWRRYSMECLIPSADPNGYCYKIYFQLKGPGKIYFDDLCIEEIETKQSKTDFYPSSVNSEKTIYPLRGEAQQLLIYPYTTLPAGNFELVLELPQGLALLAAEPVYFYQPVVKPFTVEEKNGRSLCRIPLYDPAVMPMKQYASTRLRGTALLFAVAPDAKNGELAWRIEKKGVVCDSGKIQVIPLAPYRGKLPKNFTLFNWYSPLLSHLKSPGHVNFYLDTMMWSGFSGGSIEGNRNAAVFNARKFQNRLGFAPGRAKTHCMTGMLFDGYLEQWIQGAIRSVNGYENAMVNWNFEPQMDEYRHLCDKCRKEFEAFSGKSAAGFADGFALEKAYPEDYLNFRSKQHFEVIRRYAELCRKANVGSALCCYARGASHEANLRIKRMVGRQEEYFPLLDRIIPMIYAPPDQLWSFQQITLDFWPKITPVYTTDEVCNGNSPGYSLLTPESLSLETWIAGLQGCRELMFFVGFHTLDGRQINALRRTLNGIAELDAFPLDQKEPPGILTVKNSSGAVRWKLYEGKGAYLLAVLNPDLYRKGVFEFSLRPEFGEYILINHAENTVLATAKDAPVQQKSNVPVRIGLAPGEVLLLRVESPGSAHAKLPRKILTGTDGASGSKVLCSQAPFLCRESDGNLEIVSGRNSYRILRSDGGVLAGDGIYAPGNGMGGFFRDLIRFPTAAKWSSDSRMDYDFESAKVQNGKLTVVLRHDYKQNILLGQSLEKHFTFSSDLKQISVQIIFHNKSSKPLTIAYWNHNRISGKRTDAVFRLADGTRITTDAQSEHNRYFPVSHGKSVTAQGIGMVTWSSDGLETLYFWTGSDNPSMEMFGKKIELAPGTSHSYQFLLQKGT